MAKRPAPFANAAALKAALAARALEEGFSKMGICAPDARPDLPEKLAAFLAAGHHGSMEWMADRAEWRANPAALWPEAKSVIMLAEVYTPDHDPRTILSQPEMGAISVYAQGKDYHDLVKRRLKRLGRWLIDQELVGHDTGREIKVFVDTAPVMEKPLAAAAGLGWQGKHTNVLARDLGNWFFLGAIFTNIDLPKDPPAVESCGSCRSCLDACPTGAFLGEGRLDARRCVSYLTIEHKGPVDLALRARLGNRIYGCDDCLAACPWNKFSAPAVDSGYGAKLPPATLAELARLDDAAFRARYAGSPIKRIGRDRFLRNVLYAIGNSANPDLIASAEAHLHDPDPTVAEAALWAKNRLRAGL